MKVAVFTLGCKVNEVESASIMAALKEAGYEVSDKLGYADIYVLNTCAVTRAAESKSRQLVARVRKFNPEAQIYVCGCASEKSLKPFEDKKVTFVCGATDKERIVAEICGASCPLPYPMQTKTRAFVKIEDGCNNFCSYCIIPYLRGMERSRTIADILGEISKITAPEVVLNGINISAYRDGEKGLSDLIAALAPVEKRIRLGSLECGVIDEKLIENLKNLRDFAPQFHLSLQSGSTAVLKAMNRHYTRAEYLEKCALIYKNFPDAAVTTDIIVGYPTETEEDFEESLSIVREAGLARVHAFPFSAREGTAAYKLKDLPPEVKEERLKRLLKAADEAEREYINGFCGKPLDFIAEEYSGPFTTGHTANYIKVYVEGRLETGIKYPIKITGATSGGALAELDERL